MLRKLYEKYMILMGCAGPALFFLQAYEIFADKRAQDVSLAGFLFGLLSVSSWLIYGIMLKNFVLIFSNALSVVGALAVVIGILLYS